MNEKISLNGLKKVLSPKEMKNIKAGSTYIIFCADGNWIAASADSCDDVEFIILPQIPQCYWTEIIGDGC